MHLFSFAPYNFQLLKSSESIYPSMAGGEKSEKLNKKHIMQQDSFE